MSAQRCPLPYELDGVRVLLNGVPAPLLAVAELDGFQQINLQVPMFADELPQEVDIVIEQGQLHGTARGRSMAISPGEFFRTADGAAVLQHAADYKLVTNEYPARAGDVIIAYLTGLPVTVPSVPEGVAAPSDPLAHVQQYSNAAGIESYAVVVDGKSAEPSFVGLTPGLAGVYQINFQVPAGVQAGTRQVMLERFFCRALFGSCANGGGTRNTHRSEPVTITVHGPPTTLPNQARPLVVEFPVRNQILHRD
jgi:uncharacterized protein (TIGR03437 family)